MSDAIFYIIRRTTDDFVWNHNESEFQEETLYYPVRYPDEATAQEELVYIAAYTNCNDLIVEGINGYGGHAS